MRSTLRRNFLDEIEAERARLALHEIAKIFRRAGLLGAVAKLQDIFVRQRRIEVKFSARPFGRGADGRVGRKPVLPGLLAETHFDGDVAAGMGMHMPVPLDVENGEAEPDIDRGMFVGAVVDIIHFFKSLDTLADEHEHIALRVLEDLVSNQHLPKGFVR